MIKFESADAGLDHLNQFHSQSQLDDLHQNNKIKVNNDSTETRKLLQFILL